MDELEIAAQAAAIALGVPIAAVALSVVGVVGVVVGVPGALVWRIYRGIRDSRRDAD